MITLISLTYQVSIVLVQALMFLIYLLFDLGDDLRSNPSQEGENEANQGAGLVDHTLEDGAEFAQDPLSLPSGPIIRLRAKHFKEALNGLIQEI